MSENRTTAAPFLETILVGAGKMARHHAGALMRCPATTLGAIVDPDPDARNVIGDRFGGAGLFSSLDEALDWGGPGARAVHICTPPRTHHDLALRAIEAGCHVYVEKPFVRSVAEARRVLNEAEKRGVHVCAGHQLLFEPPARRIREVFPSLGSVTHVESYFAFRPVRRDASGRRAMAADAQLFDVLPHPTYLLLDALRHAAPDDSLEVVAITVGSGGTVHALLRRGAVTGVLVVTLAGRPVESYLRVVGTRGTAHGDFVRSTTQLHPGPGTSGLSKLVAPYRASGQLAVGTSAALARRVADRKRSYPGLVELFTAFHDAILKGDRPALSPSDILDTVAVCEAVQHEVEHSGYAARAGDAPVRRPTVLVTGGTGLLGQAVVKEITRTGRIPLSLSRRAPAPWDRTDGVVYRTGDLSSGVPEEILGGIDTIVHCAAETSGGWDDHQANSLDATERLLRSAADAGVKRFVHVSSIAVLAAPQNGSVLHEHSPLEPDTRKLGPYGWGKAESEKLAARLGKELGLEVRIVRPGPIVDFERFDPPGRLGRGMGPLFVAVGSADEAIPLVDVRLAARVLSWTVDRFDEAPPVLNLLSPELPTRGELVRTLKDSSPGTRAGWLPRFVLRPLSDAAVGVQRVIRPGRKPTDVAKAFSSPAYDTGLMKEVIERMRAGWAAEEPGEGRTAA